MAEMIYDDMYDDTKERAEDIEKDTRQALNKLQLDVSRDYLCKILDDFNAGKKLNYKDPKEVWKFVTAIKILLKDKWLYAGSINSESTEDYKKSVEEFQKKNWLEADRIVGKFTLSSLLQTPAPVNNLDDQIDKPKDKYEMYQENSKKVASLLQNMTINGVKIDSLTAAAIYGNIAHESGGTFDPLIKQRNWWPGRWLCQWWWDRLKQLKKMPNPRTIEWQINFIKYELEHNEKSARDDIKEEISKIPQDIRDKADGFAEATKDEFIWFVSKITKTFMSSYERPNKTVAGASSRIRSARNFLTKFISSAWED